MEFFYDCVRVSGLGFELGLGYQYLFNLVHWMQHQHRYRLLIYFRLYRVHVLI